MGNDVSSTTARTSIPLDDTVCWQLYNGVNERSEPTSIFVAKQTYSVECRRSIQFLKTLRHPNIIKFLTGFKTYVDNDSFIADCVHPLANKLNANDIDSTAKLCLGLYQLTQALEFLHHKASITHNNVCLLSLYMCLNGVWKLGNFESACRYDNLNKKYLSSLKMIRAEECITPEEDENSSSDLNRDEIYAIDVYGFGTLIRNLMSIVHIDDSLKSLLNDLQICLTNEDPQARPTWQMLLKTQLFQIDYIKAIELLDRLPTVDQSNLSNEVNCLSTYLDNLDQEYFNELLIRRLLVPFLFLCSLTRSQLIPRILTPKDENNNNSWISMDKYRTYVLPLIIDLFSYHVTCIRETLLEYFNSYCQLIDKTILINTILPQLIYGLKDSNNNICMLTLTALSSMVPILGADIVVGGQRKQIFTDKIKRETVGFPKTNKDVSITNSPLPSPAKIKKSIPETINKTKPRPLKSTTPTPTPTTTSSSVFNEPSIIPLKFTNGHNLTLNNSHKEPNISVVENGYSNHPIEDNEIYNDDGQWSDWENPTEPTDSSTNYSTEFHQTLSLSHLTNDESNIVKPSSSSLKSLKFNKTSTSKWDPDAPLGSEYEIPLVASSNKKSIKTDVADNQETEDFFKDMAPKVETIQLMQQLETMFNINTNHPNEQTKSTNRTTSFSNKFGILSPTNDEKPDVESGTNNWDE